MNRIIVCLVVIGLSAGCEPQRTECDDTVDEVREVLEACGIDLGDYDGGPAGECTEALLGLEECLLACYAMTPRDAFRGEDEFGRQIFFACRQQCLNEHT